MTYIPIVPHVPVEETSPRTRELAGLLGRVIEEYEKHHPSVTGPEVRAALQIAGRASKGGSQAAVVAVVLGVALTVGMVVFFLAQSGGLSFGDRGLRSWVIAAVGIALAVALLLKRIARR